MRALPNPVYTLSIEFEAGSFTNVSNDCLKASIDRGLATWNRPLSVGVAGFILDNFNGKYSPSNSASALHGLLKLNRNIKFEATHSGSTYHLFTGLVKSYNVNPLLGDRKVTIQAEDQVYKLRSDINLPLLVDTNPASLFAEVMVETGVNSFSSDELTESIPYAWWNDRRGNTSIQEILKLGYYWFRNSTENIAELKGRYYNIEGSVVSSYDEYFNFQYGLNDSEIFNDLKVQSTPRIKSTSVRSIAHVEPSIYTIPASGHLNFWLDYVDPDNNEENTPSDDVITPVSSIDFFTNTASGGGGTDRTSTTSLSFGALASTAICSLFNGSGDAVYLTSFNIRGYPVQRVSNISARSIVSSSVSEYESRKFTLRSDFIRDPLYAQDYADYLVTISHDPLDKIRIAQKSIFPNVLIDGIGDLLHIKENETGVNDKHTIIDVKHDINLVNGVEHVVNYNLEHYQSFDWLQLDIGRLDINKLGF